jgi:hypothetical protein
MLVRQRWSEQSPRPAVPQHHDRFARCCFRSEVRHPASEGSDCHDHAVSLCANASGCQPELCTSRQASFMPTRHHLTLVARQLKSRLNGRPFLTIPRVDATEALMTRPIRSFRSRRQAETRRHGAQRALPPGFGSICSDVLEFVTPKRPCDHLIACQALHESLSAPRPGGPRRSSDKCATASAFAR